MVAPEFLDSTSETVVARPAGSVVSGAGSNPRFIPSSNLGVRMGRSSNDGGSGTHNCGEITMQNCEGLLALASVIAGSGSTFFDPALLAHLDAALAHELASRARSRAETATGDLHLAIAAGQPTESLASLAAHASAMKAAASKAESRAAAATEVISPLGGTPTEAGFDAFAVEQVSAAKLVDLIEGLEVAKNALAAVQAHAQTLFVARQRLSQAQSGVAQEKLGKGIAHQVALARRESPHRGRQLSELSEVLVRELPCSMAAFAGGQLSEYRVGIMAAETAFLSLEHRVQVDQHVCGDLDTVGLLGTRELRAAARNAAYALDPEAFVKRNQKAVDGRYVSLRPADAGMTFLTALIPLKQGVRILNTLNKVAGSARAAGDDRSKGQVMADAFMHRLIHHEPCDEGAGTLSDHRGVPPGMPSAAPSTNPAEGSSSGFSWGKREPWCTALGEPEIALELVMTDKALFGSGKEPAILLGYEPIPAPLARDMVLGQGHGNINEAGGRDEQDQGFAPRVWLKRLFTHPGSGTLLAMDSRSRLFPEGMKEFLRLRDQRCQTPFCDAPIREYDHIKAYAAGGATAISNGQGLCAACNQAKEAPDWSFERWTGRSDGAQTTETITPTGHRYVSTAPPLPGPARRSPNRGTKRRC